MVMDALASSWSKLSLKFRQLFGLFSLTPFELRLIDELRRRLSPEYAIVLQSQMNEFNQTDRLVGKARGEMPSFGHTSFYKNVFGKSLHNFRMKFPSSKDSQTLATLDVVEPDNIIHVKFVLVRGVFFSIEYRSPNQRYVPRGGFDIANFEQLPL